MGTRLIRDRSRDGNWWLMVGLFTLCVVGWSMALAFKTGAADVDPELLGGAADRSGHRNWQVADFNRVSVAGRLDVVLVQGNAEAVRARGSDTALDRLDVYVESGELIIKPKRDRWWRSHSMTDIRLVVELQNIERLVVSGAATISTAQIKSQELEVVLSGSSDIELQRLAAQRLEVLVSGSADVSISGKVIEQVVTISGSAEYLASALASDVVRVRISGSGEAQVAAAESLDVSVSGSGTVRYLGAPKVRSRVSGSGEVTSL